MIGIIVSSCFVAIHGEYGFMDGFPSGPLLLPSSYPASSLRKADLSHLAFDTLNAQRPVYHACFVNMHHICLPFTRIRCDPATLRGPYQRPLFVSPGAMLPQSIFLCTSQNRCWSRCPDVLATITVPALVFVDYSLLP